MFNHEGSKQNCDHSWKKLKKILKMHVQFPDPWMSVNAEEFEHFKMNHRYNFVNPLFCES